MKIVTKLPKVNKKDEEELLAEGFKKFHKSSNVFLAIFGSLPLMYLTYVIWKTIMEYFGAEVFGGSLGIARGSIFSWWFLGVVIGTFLLTLVHEILHLVVIPNFLKSEKTYFGITWFGGFVYSGEKISKRRFMFLYIFPYVSISLILMPIFGYLGWLNNYTGFMFFLNSLGSSVDIGGTLIAFLMLPKGCTVTQLGTHIYHREED